MYIQLTYSTVNLVFFIFSNLNLELIYYIFCSSKIANSRPPLLICCCGTHDRHIYIQRLFDLLKRLVSNVVFLCASLLAVASYNTTRLSKRDSLTTWKPDLSLYLVKCIFLNKINIISILTYIYTHFFCGSVKLNCIFLLFTGKNGLKEPTNIFRARSNYKIFVMPLNRYIWVWRCHFYADFMRSEYFIGLMCMNKCGWLFWKKIFTLYFFILWNAYTK